MKSQGSRKLRLLGAIASAIFISTVGANVAKAQSFSQPYLSTSPEQLLFGGTTTAADTLTLTVSSIYLPNGQESVHYTVQTGDTLTEVSQGLANAINADQTLLSNQVTASALTTAASTPDYLLDIYSTSLSSISYSVTESSGSTETLNLSVHSNPVKDVLLSGILSNGDALNLLVTDSGLSGGNKTITSMIESGDTLDSAASNLALAVNSDSTLRSFGITATANLGKIVIQSRSPNTTSYSVSVTGTSESLLLSDDTNLHRLASFTGSPTAGHELGLIVEDSNLSAGATLASYTVQTGDSADDVAAGLAAAINADSDLANSGTVASSAGGALDIASAPSEVIAMGLADDIQYLTGNAPGAVNCYISDPLATTWPGNVVKVCYANNASTETISNLSSIASTVTATLSALGDTNAYPGGISAADAAAKLPTYNAEWFIFPDHSAYLGSTNLNNSGGPNVLCVIGHQVLANVDIPTLYAVTIPCPYGRPYTAVFATDGPSASNSIPTTNIPHIVAHEAGHQLDSAYASSPGTPISHSAIFLEAMGHDNFYMNLIPTCNYVASDGMANTGGGYWNVPDQNDPTAYDQDPNSGGEAGFFSHIIDPNSGGSSYFCGTNGNSRTISGSANDVMIRTYYGDFWAAEYYGTTGGSNPASELFAEEYASSTGFVDFTYDANYNPGPGSDGIFNNSNAFMCTQHVSSFITADGNTSPSGSDLDNFTYVVPSTALNPYGPNPIFYGCGGTITDGDPWNFNL